MTFPSGYLLVDKAAHWTSHDAVAVVRRAFPGKMKVGHAGTLDPLATGLLILLVGKATKDSAALLKLPKVYTGTILFGKTTESGDLEGAVTEERPVPPVSEGELAALFSKRTGEVVMPVPKYSAVKRGGRALYEYMRAGEAAPEVLRTSRIDRFELLKWNSPEADFRLACASGTYVRSMAELVGADLGCGAVLSSLRRESIGGFSVEGAVSIEELKSASAADISARLKNLSHV